MINLTPSRPEQSPSPAQSDEFLGKLKSLSRTSLFRGLVVTETNKKTQLKEVNFICYVWDLVVRRFNSDYETQAEQAVKELLEEGKKLVPITERSQYTDTIKNLATRAGIAHKGEIIAQSFIQNSVSTSRNQSPDAPTITRQAVIGRKVTTTTTTQPTPIVTNKAKDMPGDFLVAFYKQEGKDTNGRTLKEIWELKRADKEAFHDFIQWLFPLKDPSRFVDAPLLTDSIIEEMKRDPNTLSNLKESFRIMLEFYGLVYDEESHSVKQDPKLTPQDFEAIVTDWTETHPHNLDRISRILQCLCIFDLKNEALAFFKKLEQIVEIHPSCKGSLPYWRGGALSALIILEQTNRRSDNIAIVQKPQTIAEFMDHEYPLRMDDITTSTDRKSLFRKRLQGIAEYFQKDVLYPTRGDGNCFCNAAVAGILHGIKREKIDYIYVMEVISKSKDLTLPYIKPEITPRMDGKPIPAHLREFDKESDFLRVNKGFEEMMQGKKKVDHLASDFEFTASFSRLIRYMVCAEVATNQKYSALEPLIESDQMQTTGNDLDASMFVVLNELFKLNTNIAILEGPIMPYTPTDDIGTRCVVRVPDQDRDLGFQRADLLDLHVPPPKHAEDVSFLLVRKSNHWIALVG